MLVLESIYYGKVFERLLPPCLASLGLPKSRQDDGDGGSWSIRPTRASCLLCSHEQSTLFLINCQVHVSRVYELLIAVISAFFIPLNLII